MLAWGDVFPSMMCSASLEESRARRLRQVRPAARRRHPRFAGDISQAREFLGYEPQVSFEEACTDL